jgi:hypothetical protein
MYVPAEWTNLAAGRNEKESTFLDKLRPKDISIGSVADLLYMRVIVDALLNPPVCLDHAANESTSKEKKNDAVETAISRRKGRATARGVASVRYGRPDSGDSGDRKNVSQNNRGNSTGGKTGRRAKS